MMEQDDGGWLGLNAAPAEAPTEFVSVEVPLGLRCHQLQAPTPTYYVTSLRYTAPRPTSLKPSRWSILPADSSFSRT